MEQLNQHLNIKNEIPKNQIDIPSYDLRNLEAMERVLQNLVILQENMGVNANCINSQIEAYKNKIGGFIERINLCKRKIQALNSTNAALPFVSPTKFPSPYEFQIENRRKTVFQDIKQPPVFNKFDPRDSNKMVHKKEDLGQYSEIYKDDNHFFMHLTQNNLAQRRRNLFEGRNSITGQINYENLGEAPRRSKYAETFLVFNTKMNPYKHYTNIENLIVKPEEKKTKSKKDNEQIQLVEAPKTLQEKEKLQMYSASNYNYIPTVKDMPNTLNMLPSGLDDFMGGIVSLDANVGDVLSFAPSQEGLVQRRQQISDNQAFGYDNSQNQITHSPYNQPGQGGQTQYQPQQSQMSQSQPPQNQTLGQQPPTQQPSNSGPPPLSSLSQQPVQSFQPPSMGNNNNGPPPLSSLGGPTQGGPPPLSSLNQNSGPPPLSSMQPPPLTQQPTQSQPVQQPPPPANDRSALLDQIRNPTVKLRKRVTVEKGGINLKKDDGAGGGGDAPKPSGGGGGGSLMDNLKNQINLRFKALHPTQQKTGKSAKTKQVGSESEGQSDEDDE